VADRAADEGRFYKINIETRTKGLTVRARRGYYDAGR
jgi:hypothetical protein